MSDFTNFQPESLKHVGSVFAPVFTPGLGNKELVEDNGLKQAMSYLDVNPIGCENFTLKSLYKRFPQPMIDEMAEAIRRRVPEAAETQIVMTILAHL